MEHIEVLGHIEDILTDGNCKMFLIMRWSGDDASKVRKAQYIELMGEVHKFFRGVFSDKVAELKKAKEFRDFLSCTDQPDYHECCPFINHVDDKPVFNGLLRNMKNAFYGERAYLNDKNSKHVYGFAIEVTKPDKGRAIYFRRHTPRHIVKASPYNFVFTRGTIDVLKGDVFSLDNQVDSIYYELEKKDAATPVSPSATTLGLPATSSDEAREEIADKGIYVLSIQDTEMLFDLDELYVEKSKKAYDAMLATHMIDIKRDVFESSLGAKSTTKKMAKLLERGEITKVRLEEVKRACISHPDAFDFRIEEGKVIIDSDEGLVQLMSIWNKNILRDLNTEDLFSAKDPKVFLPKKKKIASNPLEIDKQKSRAQS